MQDILFVFSPFVNLFFPHFQVIALFSFYLLQLAFFFGFFMATCMCCSSLIAQKRLLPYRTVICYIECMFPALLQFALYRVCWRRTVAIYGQQCCMSEIHQLLYLFSRSLITVATSTTDTFLFT